MLPSVKPQQAPPVSDSGESGGNDPDDDGGGGGGGDAAFVSVSEATGVKPGLPESVRHLRILLCDDMAMNRRILERTLKRGAAGLSADCEWKFEQCSTGEEALAELTRAEVSINGRPFGLWVVDEHMSGAGGVLTGSEAVQQWRQHEALRGIRWEDRLRIISSTGNTEEGRAHLYRERGSDKVWGKPVPAAYEAATDILNIF